MILKSTRGGSQGFGTVHKFVRFIYFEGFPNLLKIWLYVLSLHIVHRKLCYIIVHTCRVTDAMESFHDISLGTGLGFT